MERFGAGEKHQPSIGEMAKQQKEVVKVGLANTVKKDGMLGLV